MGIQRKIRRNIEVSRSPLPRGKYFQAVRDLNSEIKSLEEELENHKKSSRQYRKVNKDLMKLKDKLNYVKGGQ